MSINTIGHIPTPFLSRVLRSPRLVGMLARDAEYSTASRVNALAAEAVNDLAEASNAADALARGQDIYESGDIPPGYFSEMADRVRGAADARAAEEQARLMVNDSALRMEYAAEHSADAMLAELDRELQTMMGAVSVIVGQLDGASTAAEAMEQGVASDWSELRRFREQYAGLREAQALVWNAGRLSPSWYDARTRSDGDVAADSLLFIANVSGRRVPAVEGDEFLVWAVRNGAHLWIPTTARAGVIARARTEHRHLLSVVDAEFRGRGDVEVIRRVNAEAEAVMREALASALGEGVADDE